MSDETRILSRFVACPKCGSQTSSHATKCPKCGAPMPDHAARSNGKNFPARLLLAGALVIVTIIVVILLARSW